MDDDFYDSLSAVIMRQFSDRRGFRQWWEQIDEDVQQEILFSLEKDLKDFFTHYEVYKVEPVI